MPPVSAHNKLTPRVGQVANLPVANDQSDPVAGWQPAPQSRRQFLQLMGASLGLAGLSGCVRWPQEELAPYAHRPANRVPGTSVVYPTAFELGGVAQGVLVVSFDGRPIKIEGNPSHPLNRGAADAIAQASVLEVYDPDRSRGVVKRDGERRIESTWEEFAKWARSHFSGDGSGICVLSEASTSPSVADMRARLKKALPKLEWFEYEALSEDNVREGLRLAYGRPLRQVLDLDWMSSLVLPRNAGSVFQSGEPEAAKIPQSTVVVSLDADLFGGAGPLAIKYARDFAAGRKLDDAVKREPPTGMNRLYVIEPVHSITGASADRRLAVRPGQIAAVAVRIAAALGVSEVKPDGATIDRSQAAFLDPLIADLKKAEAGRTVVVAGPRQPPEVHALVAAINHRLGNNGKTVVYYADPGPERPSHFAGLRTLVGTMKSGEVKTLFILGGNPVYDAPADLKFAEALDKVPNRIHLALHEDETSQLCTWHLSRAHYLEAWGDVRTYDGTVSITQPLIQPLFDGRSTIEVLAMLTGDKEGLEGGQKIVRRTMKSLVGDGFDEWKWKKSLAEGVVDGTAWKPVELAASRVVVTSLAGANADPTAEKTLDLVFLAEGKTHDGRFANNGWLREFPEPMTRLTWDNAALISPATAEAQQLRRDQIVVLQMPGSERQLHVPVFILPGMADGVIALALGYGRKSAGNVGNEVGQNAYLARTSNGLGWRPDVTIAPSERTYRLATVQDHHTIDAVGKKATQERIPQLVVEGTLDEYAEEPSLGVEKTSLPSIFNEHKFDGRVDGAKENELVEKHQLHKWGMAIDLTACTGCGACVVACQAENNIPIVGKEQVLLGREMHWIRVDRYFRDAEKGPESVHQPLPCMHCENAPCESVCPVAATTHSQEGINMMTYNRCVGVRYCLNNCPYKVRRFNYFDFNRGTLKDQYEPNLLRHPDSELAMMQKNPEVTVRSRGVMEKCTYCVQRIEHARIAARREGNRPIRDGEIQTACQQSCPAGAIVFGDLNDPKSRVSKLFAQARAYGLLDGYLNTKPRTVYLARVRNT